MAETCEKREFWLILDIEEDQSLVLVKECNVICDHETVKIGDKVKVIYNSEDWTGEVVLRGEDREELNLKLSKLKKARKKNFKKEDSYHDDRPRKAADKCRSQLKEITGTSNQKGKQQAGSKKGKNGVKDKKAAHSSNQNIADELFQDENSETAVSKSDESNDETVSLSQLKELHKDSKKCAASDVKELKHLAAKEKSKKSESTPISVAGPSNDQSKNVNDLISSNDLDFEDNEVDKLHGKRKHSSSDSSSSSDSDSSTGGVSKKRKKAIIKHVGKSGPDRHEETAKELGDDSIDKSDKITGSDGDKDSITTSVDSSDKDSDKDSSDEEPTTFEGTMFLNKSSDDNVEELPVKSGAYIKSSALKTIKQTAKSGTAVCRKLLVNVFTNDAIMACSVCGNESTGKGKLNAEVRPRLDKKAIEAIVAYSRARVKKKGWPEVDDSKCHSAMASLLCEKRAAARMAALRKAALKKDSKKKTKKSKKKEKEKTEEKAD